MSSDAADMVTQSAPQPSFLKKTSSTMTSVPPAIYDDLCSACEIDYGYLAECADINSQNVKTDGGFDRS